MIALNSNGKSNRGGARPGAGRKPSEATQRKRALWERMNAVAEKGLDFLERLIDDEGAPDGLRFQAAIEAMNRAWGKAVARQEIGPPQQPLISPERQQLMLSDPVACALACELDERMADLSTQFRDDCPQIDGPVGAPSETMTTHAASARERLKQLPMLPSRPDATGSKRADRLELQGV
jgi:hypothetical protein